MFETKSKTLSTKHVHYETNALFSEPGMFWSHASEIATCFHVAHQAGQN